MPATLPWMLTAPSLGALTLGAAGLVYLTTASRLRRYRPGYLGVALRSRPAFYLAGIGVMERRQGRRGLGRLIEALGLSVVFVTSFVQSVIDPASAWYFALVLVEGIATVYWGAARRAKAPFFMGIGAVLLMVLAQLVNLFAGGSTVTRWLIIGGVGPILAGLAVLVERQRARLIAHAQALAVELERWD